MDQPGESRLESLLLDSAVPDRRSPRRLSRVALVLLIALALLSFWWSRLPDAPAVDALHSLSGRIDPPPGALTTATLIDTLDVLLEKPGGWLSNDVMPPGAWLDNMPAFESGAMAACRDLARALLRDFAREASQTLDDPDLQRADPRLHFDGGRWLTSESEYRAGSEALQGYLQRLLADAPPRARFDARPEALSRWLLDVDARLAAHGRTLAAASPEGGEGASGWTDQDDDFFAARGYGWALRVQLQAVASDFRPVLASGGADRALQDAIRELDGTQRPLRSPLILGGSEYGMLANHSLVMAGYIARARADLQRVREMLASASPH